MARTKPTIVVVDTDVKAGRNDRPAVVVPVTTPRYERLNDAVTELFAYLNKSAIQNGEIAVLLNGERVQKFLRKWEAIQADV